MSTTNVFAYVDGDIDGVEDKDDKCPNTRISDLVDSSGCSIKSLQNPHHFDILLGSSYSQANYNTNELSDTFFTTVMLDYYYKNFSVGFSTAYFSSNSKTSAQKGFNDSYLTLMYTIKNIQNLSIQVGGGLILPSYKSEFHNTTDYLCQLNLEYKFKKINIFASYSYTMIKDGDAKNYDIEYKNANTYDIGFGIFSNDQLHNSLSYSYEESIYTHTKPSQTLYLQTFYTINQNWFATSSLGYGLNNTASTYSLSMQLGYYF